MFTEAAAEALLRKHRLEREAQLAAKNEREVALIKRNPKLKLFNLIKTVY